MQIAEQSNESAVNLFKTPSSSLLSFIGGLDISYRKDDNNACVALVVISYPELKLVYESCFMVEVTKPYIPGFLAFREVEFFMKTVNELKANSSEYFPQVILVDGNGILHPKMFGLASHLGVLLDIPCIGVAKSLHFVDGLQRDVSYRQKVESLNKAGDYFYLLGTTGNILGAALKTCKAAKNPVFVSQGHRCSLESAIAVVKLCSIYRVPEPTRLADIQSRKFLQQEIHTTSSCKPNTTR
ncbi:endonuclease V-like isoform X2 [Tachypleus tridentatus]|uniref:endonuclease V-like isoform X2 n=1 Tax=Tachypleus tridentatus TaxID=6853 RepID=UPI003FD3B5CD